MYTYFLNGICDKFGIDSSSLDDESLSLIKQAYDELQPAEKPKKKSSFPWLKVLGGTALAAGGAYAGGKYLNGGQNFLTPFTNKVDSLFQKTAPEASRISSGPSVESKPSLPSPSVESKPSLPSPSADAENPDGSFTPTPRFMDRLKSWLKPTPSPTGDMPFDLDHGPDALTQSLNEPPINPTTAWDDWKADRTAKLNKTFDNIKPLMPWEQPPVSLYGPHEEGVNPLDRGIPDATYEKRLAVARLSHSIFNPNAPLKPIPKSDPTALEFYKAHNDLDEKATRAGAKAIADQIAYNKANNRLSYNRTRYYDFNNAAMKYDFNKELNKSEGYVDLANTPFGSPRDRFAEYGGASADIAGKAMLGEMGLRIGGAFNKNVNSVAGPILSNPAVRAVSKRLPLIMAVGGTIAKNDDIGLVNQREGDLKGLPYNESLWSKNNESLWTRIFQNRENLKNMHRVDNAAREIMGFIPGNHMSEKYPNDAKDIYEGNEKTFQDISEEAQRNFLRQYYHNALKQHNQAAIKEIYNNYSPEVLKHHFPKEYTWNKSPSQVLINGKWHFHEELRDKLIQGHPDYVKPPATEYKSPNTSKYLGGGSEIYIPMPNFSR